MLNRISRSRSGRLLFATGLVLFAGAVAAGAPGHRPADAGSAASIAAEPGLVPPRVVEAPAPRFPYRGHRSDLVPSALVMVRVTVDEQGRPGAAAVEQTALGRAYQANALKAVKRWTFEPARRDGVAVAQAVLVPVVFEAPGRKRVDANSVEPLALQLARPPQGPVLPRSAALSAD